MFTILHIIMLLSGIAFWGFVLFVFIGAQKDLFFSKSFKFIGYKFSIISERGKNLSLKIEK